MADDIDALVNEWGEGDVQASFWLQKHIKDHGIEGIGYMEAARNHLNSRGELITEMKVKSHMDERY